MKYALDFRSISYKTATGGHCKKKTTMGYPDTTRKKGYPMKLTGLRITTFLKCLMIPGDHFKTKTATRQFLSPPFR
ncbi:hypothetical protein [Desulfocicer vacuolatum]|uniref:hypothetical protein n=1 Tax=Desulfocicer vacuolatum TaxID=2298 RepID=UPI001BAE78B5|nr:hypothetical protein [Desulfocicer vacuolatum]